MELWVRSQDKMKLVKVNYVYIMDQQDHFTLIGETIDSGPIIAIYKTKERALEVLDEIQNILETRNDVSQMVYEMPKE
jgi:mevalonate pyrophosphate decarboxylase